MVTFTNTEYDDGNNGNSVTITAPEYVNPISATASKLYTPTSNPDTSADPWPWTAGDVFWIVEVRHTHGETITKSFKRNNDHPRISGQTWLTDPNAVIKAVGNLPGCPSDYVASDGTRAIFRNSELRVQESGREFLRSCSITFDDGIGGVLEVPVIWIDPDDN